MLAGKLLEPCLVEAENVADALEILELGFVDHAVGRRDVEQAVEDMLECLRLAGEEPADLPGIGLVAGDVLLREIEEAVDLLLDGRRNLDGALEGPQSPTPSRRRRRPPSWPRGR